MNHDSIFKSYKYFTHIQNSSNYFTITQTNCVYNFIIFSFQNKNKIRKLLLNTKEAKVVSYGDTCQKKAFENVVIQWRQKWEMEEKTNKPCYLDYIDICRCQWSCTCVKKELHSLSHIQFHTYTHSYWHIRIYAYIHTHIYNHKNIRTNARSIRITTYCCIGGLRRCECF